MIEPISRLFFPGAFYILGLIQICFLGIIGDKIYIISTSRKFIDGPSTLANW